MKDKVSIIVPVYNAEKYLKKCLNSILGQTYQNLEILCVNDGSIDNSLSILQEFSKRDQRIIIVNISNSGVSHARNIAIKKSTGNYVMFIDADDYIEPTMVEDMLKEANKKESDVVRCINFLEYESGKIKNIEDFKLKNKCLTKKEIDNEFLSSIIYSKLLTYSCLLLIKKETLLKTNLFDEKLKVFEDRVFYLELFLNLNKVYFLNKPLYHYVIHQNSCLNSINLVFEHLYNTLDGWQSIYNILEKYNKKILLKDLNTEYLKIIINYLYDIYKNFPNEFKKNYSNLIDNKVLKEILKNYNEKKLNYFTNKSIISIKRQNYYSLKRIYFMKKVINIFRKILSINQIIDYFERKQINIFNIKNKLFKTSI